MSHVCFIILRKACTRNTENQQKWLFGFLPRRFVTAQQLLFNHGLPVSLFEFMLGRDVKLVPFLFSPALELINLRWHQVGLPGFDSMPSALTMLSKQERASYCNHYWEQQFKKVYVWPWSSIEFGDAPPITCDSFFPSSHKWVRLLTIIVVTCMWWGLGRFQYSNLHEIARWWVYCVLVSNKRSCFVREPLKAYFPGAQVYFVMMMDLLLQWLLRFVQSLRRD